MEKTKLYYIRKNANKTQKEVAEYIGVSYQAIQKYENGTNQADYSTLKKLSAFFNVSVDYLIGNTDDPRKFSAWSNEEKALGVGNHGTKLSEEEWDWLELLSLLKEKNSPETVQAVKTLILTFIEQKK